MPMFRLAYGGTYTVSGVPVVTNDLASEITGSIAGLLVAAVLVMAATLLIVFRSRLRCCRSASRSRRWGSRSASTVAAGRDADDGLDRGAADPDRAGGRLRDPVPVARAGGRREARRRRRRRRRRRSRGRRGRADDRHRRRWPPPPAFLVLLLSPVPMVRGFGLLLVVGIAIALVCALTAGLGGARARRHAAAARRRARCAAQAEIAARRAARSWLGAAAPPGGGERSRARRLARSGRGRRWRGAVRRPERVLAVGLVLAAARLGRRHADVGPDRRDQAGAVEHAARCGTCARSSGSTGVVGRDRRDGPRRATSPTPSVDRMDDPLRERAAGALRLRSRRKGCAQGDAVPGALAARPVLDAARRAPSQAPPSAADDQRPARGPSRGTSPRR